MTRKLGLNYAKRQQKFRKEKKTLVVKIKIEVEGGSKMEARLR